MVVVDAAIDAGVSWYKAPLPTADDGRPTSVGESSRPAAVPACVTVPFTPNPFSRTLVVLMPPLLVTPPPPPFSTLPD